MGDSGDTASAAASGTYASGGLRRLTQAEYQNSVSDLLGSDIQFKVPVDADPSQPGVFSTVVASTTSSTPQDVAQYDASAQDLASQRFANPQESNAFVGCTPSGNANDTCIQGFLQKFGQRIFRRPLTSDETARYLAAYATIYKNSNDPWFATQELTAALLDSPKFLYRSELGELNPQQSVRVFNGYEIAARLSYFLWNSTPDDDLLQAAAAGILDTPAGIAVQAQRLLQSPRARPAVDSYFAEWLGYTFVGSLSKDPNLFLAMSPTLGNSMRGEFDHLVESLVFDQNADITSLLTTQSTFLNSELATLYGIPGINGNDFVPYTYAADNARGGLLTMGGYLAVQSPATRTSPTHRGLFIREALLCEDLPGPPANVPPFQEVTPNNQPETMRQRLTQHKADPSCASCHDQMDPLGFALEHFDGIGAWRATDQGLPLDTTGTLDGAAFSDGHSLEQRVQAHPNLKPCITRQLYTYALGQAPPGQQTNDMNNLTQQLENSGNQFQTLILGLVQSDAFRYAGGLR